MPFSLCIKISLILIEYNLIFQTIVEEICGEISPQNTVNMAIKKPIKKLKKFLDYECKEKLSVQLCGLLRSGIHCLKGGQSLQYTSLLLINKIIDTLIIYDISRFPIELNETQVFVKAKDREGKVKHREGKETGGGKKSHQIITQMPSILSADNNQKQIITSLKMTTMNSSFKEGPITGGPATHSVQHRFKRKPTTDKSRLTRKTISNWLRIGKSGQPSVGSSIKKDSSGPNTTSAGGGATRALGIRLSAGTDSTGKQLVGETTSQINTNLLSILVKEGIDLILNVLNNAITLHKRVTGSKQCCTPSHR